MNDDEAQEFLSLGDNLEPNQALSPDSELFVDTAQARGSFSFHGLYQRLGVDPQTLRLLKAPDRRYLLFLGHIGCGKSTELRRLQRNLHTPNCYHVLLLDARSELDPQNLQYVDLLLACAERLCATLQANGLTVASVHLERLHNWFVQHVETRMTDKTLSTELVTTAQAGFDLPLIGSLLAKLTNAFKYNASYKDELRKVVRNSFAEFATTFNILIAEATRLLQQNNLGAGLLFIVDGTDKLNSEDSCRFFIEDVHQLQQIRANFIYGAPMQMLFESSALQQHYSALYRLPMIKLYNRDGSPGDPVARATLQDLVLRRVPLRWFDSMESVDYLIDHCGGHPRDLVRLLSSAWQTARQYRIDRAAAEKAVASAASDFRRLLEAKDYALLHRIDAGEEEEGERPELIKLFNILALLEYNDHWWRSHPVVQLLPGYRSHAAAAPPA
ncbi:MAG: ATP-binding protein [Magnetococcales bacterium]|nr:ATP-binding protein [Magnetococcales bacterium]